MLIYFKINLNVLQSLFMRYQYQTKLQGT